MDGIHDMGGMQGFGRVETDEPESMGFHQLWHGRMFAISRAVRFVLPFGGDHVRAAIERLPPLAYLRASYYQKWLEGNVACLAKVGVLSEAELAGGEIKPLPGSIMQRKPLSAAEATKVTFSGMPAVAAATAPKSRFKAGETVTTRANFDEGHTRLPRYARGKPGKIEAVVGAFVLADSNAAGKPRQETVYRVAFAARDLWGDEATKGDSVVLDLWESYFA